jgi:hypothetical protein
MLSSQLSARLGVDEPMTLRVAAFDELVLQ